MSVDLDDGSVRAGGQTSTLRPKELQVLAHLARAGRPVPTTELLAEVWRMKPSTRTRTVDMTVYRLRQSIELAPSSPRFLVTVHGEGYLLRRGSADSRWRVPAPVTPFVGRPRAVQTILSWLAGGPGRLLTLVGVGGAGKTRLLLEVLGRAQAQREVRLRFSDGVVLVRLQAIRSGELATKVLEALGVPVDEELSHDERLRRALRDRALLLALDNFEHLTDEAGTLLGWLEACPGLVVIVTSRTRLGLRAETRITVGGLDREDGVELLRQRLAGQDLERAAADEAWMGEAVDALAGLPMALELLAAAVEGQDAASVLHQVRQDLDRLATTHVDVPDRHRSLRAMFDHSWALLGEAERQALGTASVFRGPFDAAQAEALGISAASLAALVGQSLIAAESGRYSLHPLIAQFAAEHLDDPGVRARLGAWAIQRLTTLGDPAHPAWDAIDAEWPDLVEGWQAAWEADDPDVASLIPAAEGLQRVVLERGHRARWSERLHALARRLPRGDARAELELRSIRLALGTSPPASLRERLQGLGATRTPLYDDVRGRLELEEGHPEAARAHLDAAADAYRRAGQAGAWADAELATAEAALRLPDTAGVRAVLSRLRQARPHPRVAVRVDLLEVRLHATLQDHRRAVELGEALWGRPALPTRPARVAELELALAVSYRELGEPDPAMRWSTRAEQSFRALGRLDRVSEVLARRADILAGPSRTEEALWAADAALGLADEIGSRRARELALFSKGRVLRHARRYDEAAIVYERLLADGLSSPLREQATQATLAETCKHLDRLDEAAALLDALEPALRDAPRAGAWPANRMSRAGVYARQGAFRQAGACCAHALRRCQERGYQPGVRLCLLHLTETLVEADHPVGRPLVRWWQAQDLARESDRRALEDMARLASHHPEGDDPGQSLHEVVDTALRAVERLEDRG